MVSAIWPSLSRCSDVCIKEIARFSSIVALPTVLIVDAFVVCFQKKKPHTRNATAMPLHCRQWSNQILLSCKALLAVHDGLKFAVRVSGRFLRSAALFSAETFLAAAWAIKRTGLVDYVI